MYITHKGGGEWGEGRGDMKKHVFIFRTKTYLGFYVGECPMFQKYW
jgi:hypothetical protein